MLLPNVIASRRCVSLSFIFLFIFFWWLCFPVVPMSLPTKVLNTHRKSLNLVDNPHFFEAKVSCGNLYAGFGFRMQYCGLSCVSQPNPMLVLIFLHTDKSFCLGHCIATPLFWNLFFD